jgi:RNA 2',3'-cyclic 3'-phosphodiesterase
LAAKAGSEGERWRVFLAIELPDAVRAQLQRPIDGLAPLEEWLRPNAVERIHLTLHFLGHIPVTEVERLTQSLAEVVGRHRALALSAHGVGAFPNIGRAQVLWAGIGGADLAQLTGLQAQLGAALKTAGMALEDRFHPHLTLARVRRPIRGPGRKLLTEWHARWREAEFGEFRAGEVRLMRSQLGAGPPRYSPVATFSLQ